jgi:hypothetical protein
MYRGIVYSIPHSEVIGYGKASQSLSPFAIQKVFSLPLQDIICMELWAEDNSDEHFDKAASERDIQQVQRDC